MNDKTPSVIIKPARLRRATMRRKTIKNPVELYGITLHSGVQAKITFNPCDQGKGIVFVRADLPGSPGIKARVGNVSDTTRGTSLKEGGAEIQVVEHVLAAVYALNITDLTIGVSGIEPPALDGSSLPYFKALKTAGTVELQKESSPITLSKEIVVEDSDSVLIASPSDRFSISFVVDFPGTVIGRQKFSLEVSEDSFEREIAPARTFGFLEEVEQLKKMGLALGASIENALVISKSRYINRPRFKDEAIRHKILDLIGDLGLLGRPIKANIIGERGGHKLNVALAKALLNDV